MKKAPSKKVSPSARTNLKLMINKALLVSDEIDWMPGNQKVEGTSYFRNLLEKLMRECDNVAHRVFHQTDEDKVAKPFWDFIENEVGPIVKEFDPDAKLKLEQELVRRIPHAKTRRLVYDTRFQVMKAHEKCPYSKNL